MRQDSLQLHTQQALEDAAPGPALQADSMPRRPSRPLTPYQVLRMLPRDATPAQQDSAIQAWFQPGEIHYSEQPDTLHLPGHDAGRDPSKVRLPKYYKENFFSNDSLLHAELRAGHYGVAGDPVPYTIRADNTITLLLIVCFIIIVVSISRASTFFLRQVRDFFYVPHSESTLSETTGELRLQAFLALHTCLQLALLLFLFVINFVADTFMLDTQHQLIPILFGNVLAYFLVKGALYTAVNYVFFDSKKNGQWLKTILFVVALEGLLLFPAVMLQVYFDVDMENTIYYCVFILVFIKILTFYKCWAIFFRQTRVYLQIILYFCALEIIPLLAMGGILGMIVNGLKVNF